VALFLTRQGFYLGSLVHPALGLPLLPARSPLDPTDPSQIGGALTWLGGGALLLFAVLGAWAVFGPRRPGRLARTLIFLGPVWYLATTLPLVFTYASDRHLYLPSVGPCLAVAVLPWLRLDRPWGSRRAATVVLAVATVAAAWFGHLRLQLAEAGRAATSRAYHRAALWAAGNAAPGSRLVLVPELRRDGRWIWQWALPFAMQPPFAPEDHYARLDVIEVPGAYCCPEEVWWKDRRDSIQRWLADETTSSLLVTWPRDGEDPVVRPLPAREVRARIIQVRSSLGIRREAGMGPGQVAIVLESLRVPWGEAAASASAAGGDAGPR
jgi:hypothetical protein